MTYENYKNLAKKYLSNELTYNSRGELIGGSDTNNLIPEEVKKILKKLEFYTGFYLHWTH